MSAQARQLYLNDEGPLLRPLATGRTQWPVEAEGSVFGQRPVCQVRVYQNGDARPLFDGQVAMDRLIRTGMAQFQGLATRGFALPCGPQVPDTRLTPLNRLLPSYAGGHLLTFDVRDEAEKQPIDLGDYEVVIVLEVLERSEAVEALANQADIDRIYAEAMRYAGRFYEVDLSAYDTTVVPPGGTAV